MVIDCSTQIYDTCHIHYTLYVRLAKVVTVQFDCLLRSESLTTMDKLASKVVK